MWTPVPGQLLLAACHGRTQLTYQQATTSTGTQWALIPPTSRLTPALRNLGPLSQPPQGWPLTSGLTQALGHPGALQSETLGLGSAQQWAGTSPGTPWALDLPTSVQHKPQAPPTLAPPTSRPISVLRYLGLLSQLPWFPASLTSTPAPGLGHPETHSLPCQEPAPQTSRLTLDPGTLALHPPTPEPSSAYHWASTSPRTPWGSTASCLVTQCCQPVASSICTRQGLATNWTKGWPRLPGHPQ